MVTIIFVIVFGAMLLFVAGVDVFIYQQPLLTSFLELSFLDKGTNEGFINVAVMVGFVISIIIDRRLKKNKGIKNDE